MLLRCVRARGMFAELVGATLPDDAGEDSQSFAAVLLDPATDYKRLPLINHGNDRRYSITDGNWKLVLPGGKHKAELYDLSSDVAETVNLADKHPERVQGLKEKINTIIAKGRTTPGKPQANDTDHWKDLKWMSPAEYAQLR